MIEDGSTEGRDQQEAAQDKKTSGKTRKTSVTVKDLVGDNKKKGSLVSHRIIGCLSIT